MKKVVLGFLFLLPILAFAAIPVGPSTPGTPITDLTQTSMTIHWNDLQGGGPNAETGFRVYWAIDGFTTVQYTTAANATSQSITGLSPNTFYQFRVRAFNGSGNSIAFAEMGATTTQNAPDCPTGGFVSLNTFNSQRVNWTDASTNEDGFYIYQSLDGFDFTNLVGAAGPDETFFDVAGLSQNTLYYYRVYAFNNGGESPCFASSNETTLLLLPVEMTSFTATGLDNSVSLRWRTESESNNSHFNLYRSMVEGERGELLTRIEGSGTATNGNSYSYSDTRVFNGVTYYYQISDVSIDGIETMARFVANATPAPHALGVIPFKYNLSQNFPNPFNPATEITYGLHEAGSVRLMVFNELGKEVATLVNGYQAANTYRISFNAAGLPSGTYYYTLSTNGFTTTKKMVLTK